LRNGSRSVGLLVSLLFASEAQRLMIGITIPIIPGVMPIQNFSSFRRLVKLTGCPVPDAIMKELEPISVSSLP
jgi:5,10-methylenetetrahydrofolate reductase